MKKTGIHFKESGTSMKWKVPHKEQKIPDDTAAKNNSNPPPLLSFCLPVTVPNFRKHTTNNSTYCNNEKIKKAHAYCVTSSASQND